MKMTITIHAILDRFRLEATSNRDGSIGVSGRSNIINVSMLFMTGVSDVEYLRR